MKILVPVKRVIDFNVKPRVRPDGSGVDLDNVKMSINPFDEIAVEAAVRLREVGIATEVIVVSIGPQQAEEVLRNALAMGADRALLIRTEPGIDPEPLAVAKLLQILVTKEAPGLVVTGKQAIDNDMNATGQMLAGLLDWPQATFASRLALSGNDLTVTREIDGGLQHLRLPLPAVVTAGLRLNEPRYPSLPNIMKARKKPLALCDAAEFGVALEPRLEVIRTVEPVQRPAGVKVASVAELVEKLKSEVGVI